MQSNTFRYPLMRQDIDYTRLVSSFCRSKLIKKTVLQMTKRRTFNTS